MAGQRYLFALLILVDGIKNQGQDLGRGAWPAPKLDKK